MATRSGGLRYREGDFFSVPLRSGGFATGLVARAGARGKVLVGYFFGPPRGEPAKLADVQQYQPSDAVMIARFGDLSLQNGEWRIIGHSQWNRESWPMPRFGRVDTASGERAWCVEYSEDDPNHVIRETTCSVPEAKQLPRDSLLGAGAVEIRLTQLLSIPAP